jgi:LysM repeat protein
MVLARDTWFICYTYGMASPEAIPKQEHPSEEGPQEQREHEPANVDAPEHTARAEREVEQAHAAHERAAEDGDQQEEHTSEPELNEQGRAMKHFIEERVEQEGATESAQERLAKKTTQESIPAAEAPDEDDAGAQESREPRALQERIQELERSQHEASERIATLEQKNTLSEDEQEELEQARAKQERAQQYAQQLKQTSDGAQQIGAVAAEHTEGFTEQASVEQSNDAEASQAAHQEEDQPSESANAHPEKEPSKQHETPEQRRAKAQEQLDRVNQQIKTLAKKSNRNPEEEQHLRELRELQERYGEEVAKAGRAESPDAQAPGSNSAEQPKKKRAMFAREEERTEQEKSEELKALEDKRATYLQRYQEALNSRSKWEKFKSGLKGLFGKSSDVPASKELAGAKSEYEQARTEYAQQLFDKARERIEQKNVSQEKKEQMLQRYKGLVFNEYIAKEYERFQNAKAESYPPKEKGLLRKGVEWYGRQHWSKRAGISATLATGASVATGGIATVAGAAGVFAMKGARHGAAAIAGPAAAESVGWLYEKARAGKVREESEQQQRSAKERLTREESASVLNTLEQRYLSAQHRTEREDRRKSALKLATGVATGVGTSFAIMDQATAASSVESGRSTGESAASVADREHLMTDASEPHEGATESASGAGSSDATERSDRAESGGFVPTEETADADEADTAAADREHLMTDASEPHEGVAETPAERADRAHLMTEASEPETGREHLMTEGSEPHEGAAETPAETADREHLMTDASEPHERAADSVELPEAYEVQRGDTLSEILNEQYNIRDEDVYAITDALREMEQRDPERLKELGLSSGAIDEIQPGDTLNLQGLVEASGEQVDTYAEATATGGEETTSYEGAREAAAAHEAPTEAAEEAAKRSVEYIELPDSYEVQQGDTLFEILNDKYNLNEQQTHEIIAQLREIQEENNERLTEYGLSEKDPDDIRAGDILDLDKMGQLIGEHSAEHTQTPDEKPSAEILHDGIENREESMPWQHVEEEAAEGAQEAAGAYEQLSPEQQERVDAMLNDRLDELYGTEGVFGFGASPGTESGAWTHLHARDASEVLRTQVSAENAHELGLSQLDLEKTQDFLDKARQFAEPQQGENVEDFVKRAYATYVQTHSNA